MSGLLRRLSGRGGPPSSQQQQHQLSQQQQQPTQPTQPTQQQAVPVAASPKAATPAGAGSPRPKAAASGGASAGAAAATAAAAAAPAASSPRTGPAMPSTSAPSTPKPAGKGAPVAQVAQHGRPRDGMECMATMDEISESNYCEYLSMPSGTWLPSQFAADTVEHLLETQFAKYLGDVEKAAKDCAAAVRRLVSKGPPVYIADTNAMPLKEGDTHIAKLWFMSSGEERSAKLKGALDGAARDKLWGSQKETLAAMEAAEANGA